MVMLVSVIIPVFNVASYLNEALESVIKQSYKNLEIIIIDDGSTDDSGQICDEYAKKDERFHIIHQRNCGLSAARNVGLDKMNGDVVVFLDSDDAYHPDYVKLMVEALEREKTDVVICKYNVHETTKIMSQQYCGLSKARIPIAKQGLYSRKDALRALVEDSINHAVWNKLYRTELWKEIRFPTGYVYEDRDTTYKILDNCKNVYVIDQPLYLYRKRQGSITDTLSKQIVSDRFQSCFHFASYVENHIPDVFSEKHLKITRQSCIKWLIGLYIHNNEPSLKGWLSVDDLKHFIIEKCREMQVETCCLHMKTAYWLFCHFPFWLKVAYKVYRPFRLGIWKAFKK